MSVCLSAVVLGLITKVAATGAVGCVAHFAGESRRLQRDLKGVMSEESIDNFLNYIQENKISFHSDESSHVFETIYVDGEILKKTLEEHGVNNLKVENETITCNLDGFNIRFHKEGENPYMMELVASSEDGLSGIIEDLDSEYAQNVQEVTYLKIKERLERENLQINEEEVLEDNTIILTINLD